MTVIPSCFLVAVCLLVLVPLWDTGLHLARLFHKKQSSDAPEKTLIFVKLQVCLSAYPKYFV